MSKKTKTQIDIAAPIPPLLLIDASTGIVTLGQPAPPTETTAQTLAFVAPSRRSRRPLVSTHSSTSVITYFQAAKTGSS